MYFYLEKKKKHLNLCKWFRWLCIFISLHGFLRVGSFVSCHFPFVLLLYCGVFKIRGGSFIEQEKDTGLVSFSPLAGDVEIVS